MNPAEPIKTWLLRIFSPLLYQLSYPANNGQQYKYPLEPAVTVPQAVTEMQALKRLQREGKLFPPGIVSENAKKEHTKECAAEGHPIQEAVGKFQSERDQLEKKDQATCDREDSSLNQWLLGFGDRPISVVDGKMHEDFALFCKACAEGQNRHSSGRNINLEIMAMNHVQDWAVTEKWLPCS